MSHVDLRALSASLVLLTACGAPPEEQPDVEAVPNVSVVADTTFLELPMGRSADNGEISVVFDGVSEDSRCPTDVQCVWEGNGAVLLTLASGDVTQVVMLNSALDPQQASFGPYTIRFRDLTPYPVSTEPFDRADYVAHVAIVDTR